MAMKNALVKKKPVAKKKATHKAIPFGSTTKLPMMMGEPMGFGDMPKKAMPKAKVKAKAKTKKKC